MSDMDLARELVSMPRSVRAIALALMEASPELGGDRSDDIGKLVERLAAHEGEIDALAIPDTIVALASIFAVKTDTAPKQIWEQMWKDAPTDEWWRETLKRGGR